MKVLAVDPGKTTGWALWSEEYELIKVDQHEHFDFLNRAKTMVYDGLDVIVCEAYRITPATLKKTRQDWSLKQIGVLEFLAWHEGKDFTLQTAAEAKGFVDDDKLRNLGWWQPGRDHARDALRHLALFLVRQRLLDPRLMVGSTADQEEG